MDLSLLLVFFAYFLMGFDCEFIFIWKPICGNSLRSVLTVLPERTCVCFGQVPQVPSTQVHFTLKCSTCGLLDHANSAAIHLIGKCFTSPLRTKAERDNFLAACLCREDFLQFILPLKIYSFLGPNLMFQFGSHPAWTQADDPTAGSSITVYLPPDMIFKIFVSMAHAPTNRNRCRLYLCITSEYQLYLPRPAFLLSSWLPIIFLTVFQVQRVRLKGCFQYFSQQFYIFCCCCIYNYVVYEIARNIVQVRSLLGPYNKTSRGKPFNPGSIA